MVFILNGAQVVSRCDIAWGVTSNTSNHLPVWATTWLCYLIFMLSLSYLQEFEEPLGCYLIFMSSLSYLQEFEEPLGCYHIFMLSLSYLQEFEEPLGCYLIFMLSLVLSPGVWGAAGSDLQTRSQVPHHHSHSSHRIHPLRAGQLPSFINLYVLNFAERT